MHDGLPFSKPKVRLFGTPGEAQAYLGEAYSLLHKVRAFCEASGAPVFAMSRNMPNGAIVTAAVIGDEHIVSCTPPAPRTVPAREKISPDGSWLGGFIYSPHDGSYDNPDENTTRSWSDVFAPTTAYDTAGLFQRKSGTAVFPVRPDTSRKAEHVSWVGKFTEGRSEYEAIVTWDHGLSSRYRLWPSQDCSGRTVRIDEAGYPEFANSGFPGVCVNGFELETCVIGEDGYNRVFNVVGAAVFENMLVVATHTDFSWRPNPDLDEIENAKQRAARDSTTLTVLYRTATGWKIAGFEKFEPPMFLRAPWFFSPDGSKAITVLSVSTVLQYKLGVDLTATDGVVSALFSRSTLSCEAPYLDTLGDPIVLNPYTPAQWLAPGEWVYCGYGWEGSTVVDSLLDAPYGAYSSWAAQFAQQKFDAFPNEPKIMYGFGSESARFYDIGWQYGSTGTIGTSLPARNDWWAYYDTPGPSASFQIFLVTFNAYRDTFYRNASTGSQSRFARNFTGKQYIAADFSSSGAERILTLEAADDNPYCLLGSDDYSQRSEFRPSRVVTEWYNVTERKRTRDVAIAGTTAWVLKCNGVEWLRVSGGVDGRYDRNRVHIQTTVFPAVGSYREFAVEYSHSPAKLFVERGWLIDADIRSESYIFERRRREITPDDPIDTGTEVGTAGVMEVFSGQQITRDSLTVVVNGETVSHIDFPETVNTSPTIFAAAATMQLLPRWYDLEELVEETLVQTMLWTIGSVTVPISRVWLLSPYDPHPKALRKGQLQLRLGDWAVSTSDETTRREFLGPLADPPVVYRRSASYINEAKVADIRVDPTAGVKEALSEVAGSSISFDNLRLFPVRAT